MIHKFLNKKGYEIIQYPILDFFSRCAFDVILDVGANTGEFGCELRRRFSYRSKIVSFEPLTSAFQQLQKTALKDKDWTACNYALGSSDGSFPINVANNSVSSSFLSMLPRHTEAAPHSHTVNVEEAQVKRLDSIFNNFCNGTESILLKIDTQGFELEVLKGAEGSLYRIKAIQLELNLTPLYENAPLAEEVISYLRSHGFSPFWFTNGFRDPGTSQLLQMDGYFLRA